MANGSTTPGKTPPKSVSSGFKVCLRPERREALVHQALAVLVQGQVVVFSSEVALALLLMQLVCCHLTRRPVEAAMPMDMV